jgi:cytochrome c553
MYYATEKTGYAVKNVSLTEGKRMTMLMCGSCHYNPATKDFSGKKLEDAPGIIGKVYAANITQHPEYGIGRYTDGEIAYLIRTGVSKEGKRMPYMQRPNLSDEDLQNIIAYLKSGDAFVQPSARIPGRTKYTAIGKMAISLSKPLPYTDRPVEKPKDNPIALGQYLVDNLACYHCHSKSFTSLQITNPEQSKGYMGGGNKLKNAAGKTVRSPNITFHASGIGNWSQKDFARALTEGVSKEGNILTYPMPLFPELREEEISAIYAYLKSIPAIKNKVK